MSGRLTCLGATAGQMRVALLLPAATVVLVASLLLTYLFLPPIRWAGTARDALASARLRDALRGGPSILQHYWSLAVEEQFYLLWPLLLLVVALLVSRRASRRDGGRRPVSPSRSGRHRRPFLGDRMAPWLLAAFALVGIPSLAWSIHLSQTEPARAYLVTTTSTSTSSATPASVSSRPSRTRSAVPCPTVSNSRTRLTCPRSRAVIPGPGEILDSYRSGRTTTVQDLVGTRLRRACRWRC